MFQKKAHLKVLDLHVPLNLGQQYYDDGYVADLAEYTVQKRSEAREMSPKVQRAWFKKYKQDYEDLPHLSFGTVITFEKPGIFWDTEEIHIAYLNLGDELANTFIRGRQETDALRRLGNTEALEKLLKLNYGFSSLQANQKTILDLGGAYALLRKQYTFDEMRRYNKEGLSDSMKWKMMVALRDLTNALIGSKKELHRLNSGTIK